MAKSRRQFCHFLSFFVNFCHQLSQWSRTQLRNFWLSFGTSFMLNISVGKEGIVWLSIAHLSPEEDELKKCHGVAVDAFHSVPDRCSKTTLYILRMLQSELDQFYLMPLIIAHEMTGDQASGYLKFDWLGIKLMRVRMWCQFFWNVFTWAKAQIVCHRNCNCFDEILLREAVLSVFVDDMLYLQGNRVRGA